MPSDLQNCHQTLLTIWFWLNSMIGREVSHMKYSLSLDFSYPQGTSAHARYFSQIKECIKQCIVLDDSLLSDSRIFDSEFSLLRKKCEKTSNEEKLSSVIDSFSVCNGEFYPNIKTLLCILTTLRVSTATAERSFSSLKRIKSCIRKVQWDWIELFFSAFIKTSR